MIIMGNIPMSLFDMRTGGTGNGVSISEPDRKVYLWSTKLYNV